MAKAAISAERTSKGSINLRIEARTRDLIDDAASLLGKTRTDFMVDTARSRAVDVLLDRGLFVLDDADYEVVMRALADPPESTPKLRKLLRRTPVWAPDRPID